MCVTTVVLKCTHKQGRSVTDTRATALIKQNTVIPRLTSDPANEDFFAIFWTRLTNVLVDARANIKHQT